MPITAGLGILLSGPAVFARSPLNLNGGDAVSTGIYIAPVDESAAPLIDYQSGRLMTPASTLKALTSASALSSLGHDFRWTTDIMAVGTVEDGVLEGDIVVRGTGDPTTGSRFFPGSDHSVFCERIASALSGKGISEITGTIVIDSSRFTEQGVNESWQVEDIGWDYGAGLYSFNFRDNAFAIRVPDVTTLPPEPGVRIESYVTTASAPGSPLTVSRGVGSNTVTVSGSLNRRASATLWCSTPNPSTVFIHELDSICLSKSIFIRNDSPRSTSTDTMLLVGHQSPPLSEVLHSLMERSDNLMAEGTYRALAPGAGRKAAADRTRDLWKQRGIDLTHTYLTDGSGLARNNAISPRVLGKILAWMARSEFAADYTATFPRAGLDGTLRSFMAKSRRKNEFRLKTGSMSGVHCYAGYHIDPSTGKPTHVIVIMVNNFFGPRANIRKAIENMLLDTKFDISDYSCYICEYERKTCPNHSRA